MQLSELLLIVRYRVKEIELSGEELAARGSAERDSINSECTEALQVDHLSRDTRFPGLTHHPFCWRGRLLLDMIRAGSYSQRGLSDACDKKQKQKPN